MCALSAYAYYFITTTVEVGACSHTFPAMNDFIEYTVSCDGNCQAVAASLTTTTGNLALYIIDVSTAVTDAASNNFCTTSPDSSSG